MENHSSKQTFIAGEVLVVQRLVKLNAGTVVYADATDKAIGVTTATVASGSTIGVRLLNDTGSFAFEANEAIAANAVIYAADNGKISGTDAGSAIVIGVNKDASAADGDTIECLLT
jgi:hypothetical protein|tara:strand:+ start:21 stop:368 length:348 start_codon:yes stop_codon:yes gene_type:complete